MSRIFQRLRSFLRTAAQGLRASPLASAVAVATIGVTLLLVGAFALLLANMERLLDRFGEEIRVSAYLEDELGDAERAALVARVRSVPGVESVELVTKERALERFRQGGLGRSAWLDGLETNPLPASLEIALVPERRNRPGLGALVASLEGVAGIAELGYGHEWVEAYARFVALIRSVAIGIGAVLGVATLLIVSNTIRLAIYARHEEIAILRLVGAGRIYVAVPFLLEGLLQGLAGGCLALLLLYLLFLSLGSALASSLQLLLGAVAPGFLGLEDSLLLIGTGALLGVIGSALALLQVPEA